jgi:hypothetical protein
MSRRRISPRIKAGGFATLDALVAIAVAGIAFGAVAGGAALAVRAARGLADAARETIVGRNLAAQSIVGSAKLP